MPGRRVPRRPSDVAELEYARRTWRGGVDGRSVVTYPVAPEQEIFTFGTPAVAPLEEVEDTGVCYPAGCNVESLVTSGNSRYVLPHGDNWPAGAGDPWVTGASTMWASTGGFGSVDISLVNPGPAGSGNGLREAGLSFPGINFGQFSPNQFLSPLTMTGYKWSVHFSVDRGTPRSSQVFSPMDRTWHCVMLDSYGDKEILSFWHYLKYSYDTGQWTWQGYNEIDYVEQVVSSEPLQSNVDYYCEVSVDIASKAVDLLVQERVSGTAIVQTSIVDPYVWATAQEIDSSWYGGGGGGSTPESLTEPPSWWGANQWHDLYLSGVYIASITAQCGTLCTDAEVVTY